MEHCKYCNKECKNKRSLAQHELRCKCNPNKIVIVNNFANYNKKVKNGELERVNNNYTTHKILYCKYCNKKCTSENSLVQHEIRCSCNPNKINMATGNLIEYAKKVKNGEIEKLNTNQYTKAKNNGTTYIISDDTRLKISEASKITNKNYWTDETRKKHSIKMKEVIKNNPESYSTKNVSGRVKNIQIFNKFENKFVTVKGSWERLTAEYLDENNINWTNNVTPFEYYFENKQHLYFPDFYLPEYGYFLEVKGYTRERDFQKWAVIKDKLKIIKTNEIKQIKNRTFNVHKLKFYA